MKLRPFNIEKYDGALLDWRQFWDLFKDNVDDRSDFPPATKLTYLKSYLHGEVERLIQGYATAKFFFVIGGTPH